MYICFFFFLKSFRDQSLTALTPQKLSAERRASTIINNNEN